MPLVHTGTLPVSAVNLGLAASLPGLAAKGAKLTADVSQLTVALAGQTELQAGLNPTAILGVAGAISGSLNPVQVAASLNPGLIQLNSLGLSAEGAIKLALVSARLKVAESVQATLRLGLEVGGIAGYSYAGPSAPFGSELERYTAAGIGKTPPTATVQAVVIATESFASWQAFSKSANTNGTAAAPSSARSPRLAFMGELPGARWNPGVASVGAEIDQLVADLRGEKSGIEASLELMGGANLPDPQVVLDAGVGIVADVGIDGLLDNLVNVKADIEGGISGINAQIDAVLALTGDIAAQMTAGGLSFWSYTGSASGLGRDLRAALANGLPFGSGPRAPAYGLVIAGTPAAMSLFGTVFRTS